MSTTIITKKELTIPVGVIAQVADVIIENEITHTIIGADTHENTVTLEVQFDKDEREVIHEMKTLFQITKNRSKTSRTMKKKMTDKDSPLKACINQKQTSC